MAGLWVSLGSLVAAGRRGQRSPQQLMRSAALWTLQVRSDGGAPAGLGFPGLPAPLRPAGASAAESARVAPATPAAPIPRRSVGVLIPSPFRFRVGAGQSRRPCCRGYSGVVEGRGAGEPAGMLSARSPGRLTDLWLRAPAFPVHPILCPKVSF